MEIIPVIDILGGRAVHAKRGLRESYRPLSARLCPDGNPLSLATRLLALYPFEKIYLADLDALMGKGSNFELVQDLMSGFPNVEFWIDQGLSNWRFQNHDRPNWMRVLGSESLIESDLDPIKLDSEPFLLSLDFTESGLLGPKLLIEDDGLWPQQVILMSLSCVGSNEGPDWERCEYFATLWPRHQFIAAGGVRGEQDLLRLASLGFAGALCASALHNGSLDRAAIERVMLE